MMIELLFYLALIIVAVSTLISAFNLFTAPIFANRKNESTNEPFISVLIRQEMKKKTLGISLRISQNRHTKILSLLFWMMNQKTIQQKLFQKKNR